MKTITVTGFGGVTQQIEEDNDPQSTVVTTKGEDK